MEISCAHDGISLHLLGYWPDPRHPELAAELLLNRDDRIPARRRSSGGWPRPATRSPGPTCEMHVSDGATVGRPHIADTLVTLGVVRRPRRRLRDPAARRVAVLRHAPRHRPGRGRAPRDGRRRRHGLRPPRGRAARAGSSPTTSSRRWRRPVWPASRSTTPTTTRPHAPATATSRGPWGCWPPAPATTTAPASSRASGRAPPTPEVFAALRARVPVGG